jgi:hypothetical protein
LRDYKFITTKENYLKLLKLEKWQTLKRKHFKRWRNGFRAYYGMYWCRGINLEIIMGNPSNFEGGNNEEFL